MVSFASCYTNFHQSIVQQSNDATQLIKNVSKPPVDISIFERQVKLHQENLINFRGQFKNMNSHILKNSPIESSIRKAIEVYASIVGELNDKKNELIASENPPPTQNRRKKNCKRSIQNTMTQSCPELLPPPSSQNQRKSFKSTSEPNLTTVFTPTAQSIDPPGREDNLQRSPSEVFSQHSEEDWEHANPEETKDDHVVLPTEPPKKKTGFLAYFW